MTSSTLFLDTSILRRPRVVIFADIVKIVTIFIKTIFKDSKKVKTIRNTVLKSNLYLYVLIQQNLLISTKKIADVSRYKGLYHMIDIFFRSSLGKI